MKKVKRINKLDNVAVALEEIRKGEVIEVDGTSITVLSDIPTGHKIAITSIDPNNKVIKYGYPIGKATEDIKPGMHVHTHNMATLLSESEAYSYNEEKARNAIEDMDKRRLKYKGNVPSIDAYLRKDGRIGIRNELWIIPTVGCVNGIARNLEAWGNRNLGIPDGVHAWTHPFGCSQMGNDQENYRRILADLVHHPNAGGVLVLSLGCENNTLSSFKEILGEVDEDRIRFLICQESEDEIEDSKELLCELSENMKEDRREPVSMDKLVIGMKCGGSDGLSGITANPLVGSICNEIVAMGGTAILTEVPEMFGAEQILMDRCVDKDVFRKTVQMIDSFKTYFTSHGQVVYENPSPGNKAGGISTLEDKSLGCVQKGGSAPISGVMEYGERVSSKGLDLLSGPGNDMVSTTALAASGVHMILFTTGRGTPFGSPVPTLKISTNDALFRRKSNWIDFNAGRVLSEDESKVTKDLLKLIAEVASGKKTRNEESGYSEISIFKDGVIL